MCFSAAASSENDQGSMNLASNTAPVPSTMPSRVAAIQRSTGCWTCCCTCVMTCPVLRSNQCRLRGSVTSPSWTMRLSGEVLRLGLAAFLPPQPQQGGLVVPMMTRASEPPIKVRLLRESAILMGVVIANSYT